MKLALGVLVWIAGNAYAGVDVDALANAVPACDAARAHCFAIDLHVAADANGPVTTPAWVAAELERANHFFEPLDVGFELAAVEALPESAAHIVTRADRYAIANGHVGGTKIHVFITGKLDDIDTIGNVIYGVTWHTHDATYIIVSAEAWEKTLAHELGHFFGLPHSAYAVSIMNKTPRREPPEDQRRFADEEIAAMRRVIARMAPARRS